jgi:chitodextrinase
VSHSRFAAFACALLLGLLSNIAPAAAAPKDRSAPTSPTGLRITASTDTSVSLAWNASTDNSTNWWYCVQNFGAGCIRVDPPRTTLTRSSLMPDRTFSFSVYAIDAAGNRSPSSNSVTYTTPPDITPPSPAPTLSATSVYPTRIYLRWTASVDNTSQVIYTLFVNGTPYLEDQIGLRSAYLVHLTPQTTYVFKVNARDAYGNVAESNVVSVTTPAVTETVPPTAPTNLTLGFQSSAGEAWLSWEQSTDNSDPPSQILYDIYLNGVNNNDGVIGHGSTITYCFGLEPGPTEIVLRAVDTSGNVSAPSNAVMFEC